MYTPNVFLFPTVMERQLDRIEKNLAKIVEHKELNTGSLQAEVKVYNNPQFNSLF